MRLSVRVCDREREREKAICDDLRPGETEDSDWIDRMDGKRSTYNFKR